METYEKIEYWAEKYKNKETINLFVENEICPIDLIYWSKEQLIEFIKDITHNHTKTSLMKLQRTLKELDEDMEIEKRKRKLEEKKKLLLEEEEVEKLMSEKNSKKIKKTKKKNTEEFKVLEESEGQETEDTLVKNKNKKSEKFDIKKYKIPEFKSDLCKFLAEIDAIIQIENLHDQWFDLLIRAISWESGGSTIFDRKSELINLPWKEGRKKIIEILDPNFYFTYHERVLKMKPDSETMMCYFNRFSLFIFYNTAINKNMITQIYYNSLPNFLKKDFVNNIFFIMTTLFHFHSF